MNRNKWIAVTAGILVVGFFLYGGTAMEMFKNASSGSTASMQGAVTSRLVSQDRIVGTGSEARVGSLVTVHYVGVLEDGTKFDSSLDRGVPLQFRIGAGEVISGWEQGIVGMKVGGRRILVIPPELGYGNQARGPIPANSTILFEIELLKVE